MFKMKDEFRTGIERIDQEHEKLFEIANRAYETLMDEFIVDKFDYIVEIFEELKDYTQVHFRHEEEYMISNQFKKLFSHKIEHEKFIDKVSSYNLSEIDDNQKETIMEILEFLNEWLVNHIMERDIVMVREVTKN